MLPFHQGNFLNPKMTSLEQMQNNTIIVHNLNPEIEQLFLFSEFK